MTTQAYIALFCTLLFSTGDVALAQPRSPSISLICDGSYTDWQEGVRDAQFEGLTVTVEEDYVSVGYPSSSSYADIIVPISRFFSGRHPISVRTERGIVFSVDTGNERSDEVNGNLDRFTGELSLWHVPKLTGEKSVQAFRAIVANCHAAQRLF